MLDAAIVGGGLIGLASALELSRRGLRVCVVDRGDPGQASRAAAGILGPQSEAHAASPMLELCSASYALYPQFVAPLGEVGFRACGTLHLAFSEDDERALLQQSGWQVAQGLRVEERARAGTRLALFFPDEGQVDNRKLLAALREACARGGVQLLADEAIALEKERVILKRADIAARAVVLCGGSWSGRLAKLSVRPVRGQMLAVEATPPPCVIFGAGGYAVPRGDRTLIGATMEEAGFDAATTQAGRAFLASVAAKLLPGAHAVLDHWAGLRPATPDGAPLLGRLPDGVVVATGHHRNGVLLTPISARIVAALVLGETPPVDLAPFDPLRYSTIPPGGPP